jgi:hypothetical protein
VLGSMAVRRRAQAPRPGPSGPAVQRVREPVHGGSASAPRPR